MRVILLLSLLLVTACTIREETFRSSDGAPGEMSLAPRNPNIPTDGDRDFACPGGLAQASRIEEYRDGSANLFCN